MNLGSLGRLPCSPFPPCSPACSSGPRSNLPPAFRGPRARPHLALLIRPAGLCFLITTLMPPMVPLTGGLNSLLESIMGLSEVQRSNQDKGDPRLQSMLPRGVSPVPTGAEPGGRRGCSWARRVPIGAGGQQWSSQGEGSSQARSAQLLRPDAGGGHSEPSLGARAPSSTPGRWLRGPAPTLRAGAGGCLLQRAVKDPGPEYTSRSPRR